MVEGVLKLERPLIFGEALYDHFPDGSVAPGGAPLNVAWHLQAFGLEPLFISRVGDDALGRRMRDTIQSWGMDTAGLQFDSAHPTGTVEVSIKQGEPSFEILPQRAYDFIDARALPPLLPCPVIYHGSLAVRDPCSHAALQYILAEHSAPVFMDVNLRIPWWETASVHKLMEHARWIKLNEFELRALESSGETLEEKAVLLQACLKLDLVILTLGEEGALAFDLESGVSRVAPSPSSNVVDTVGAGDAFSAVVLLGLLRRWKLHRILERAQAFASSVVGIRGATPYNKEFYTSFLNDWS
jgi:fructokinase